MKPRDAIQGSFLPAEKAFNEKKFWLGAICVYAVAEALYWAVHYATVYAHCVSCLRPVGYFVTMWFFNLVLTVLLWYCLNFFYGKSRFLTVVLNGALFAVHYFIWLFIHYGLRQNVLPELLGSRRDDPLSEFVYESWFDIGKYIIKPAAFYVLKYYAAYRIAADKRLQLALINKDLQLNLLKQQLSPHFYFNTLNNLYGLARSNDGRLRSALDQVRNIMQYVIVECRSPQVPLQKEMEFLQSYIALEKLRYEEDTVIEMRVEGAANGYSIIPLLLIQFVENAFKHGMKEKSGKNWMRINAAVQEDAFTFSVDNSHYSPASPGGVGLASVKHRLNLQYEGKYDLRLLRTPGQFSVTLKLRLS